MSDVPHLDLLHLKRLLRDTDDLPTNEWLDQLPKTYGVPFARGTLTDYLERGWIQVERQGTSPSGRGRTAYLRRAAFLPVLVAHAIRRGALPSGADEVTMERSQRAVNRVLTEMLESDLERFTDEGGTVWLAFLVECARRLAYFVTLGRPQMLIARAELEALAEAEAAKSEGIEKPLVSFWQARLLRLAQNLRLASELQGVYYMVTPGANFPPAPSDDPYWVELRAIYGDLIQATGGFSGRPESVLDAEKLYEQEVENGRKLDKLLWRWLAPWEKVPLLKAEGEVAETVLAPSSRASGIK